MPDSAVGTMDAVVKRTKFSAVKKLNVYDVMGDRK